MRNLLAFLIVLVAGCSSHPAALLKGGELLPSITWRLEVRDALGANPSFVTVSDPVVALEEFSVSGAGNCLEARFTGLASGLPIGPHSIVTLQSSTNGTDWVNRHAGEVVLSGATRSSRRSQYRTVGLAERLKTVEVPSDLTGGDAGAVARQLVQDVIAVGSLGSVLVYDAALIPDSGTTVGDVTNEAYHSVAAMLDALVASHDVDGDGNPMVWGVNADRKVFFGVAAGSVSLTEGSDFHRIDWKGTVAESTVTAVRFWLAPNLSYLTQDADLVALYGLRVKQVPVENPLDLLDPVTTIVTAANATASFTSGGTQDATLNTDRVQDGDATTFLRNASTFTVPSGAYVLPGGPSVSLTAESAFDAASIKATSSSSVSSFSEPMPKASVALAGTGNTFNGAVQSLTGIFPAGGTTAFVQVMPYAFTGTTIGDVLTMTLEVFELRALKIDRAALDLEAKAHYRAPANDPAVITTVDGTLTPPAPIVTVNLLSGESLELPAASFGYKFETRSYATTVVRLGQVDEPNELARAQIIANRDDATLGNSLQYVNAVQGVK
jgi:hypothetical protein